jgi:hypothetical protein
MIRFGNPGFLFGLLAGVLPLLVHLLWRDRIRRVAFSSLRFLRSAPRHGLRQKLVSEAVLVALRVAACLLAALVFCRPVVGPRDGTGGGLRAARAVAVVADVSASMRRAVDPVRLREEVMAVLDGLAAGDAAALLAFDRHPAVLVPMTPDRGALSAAVRSLAPGHGGTDLAAALRRADDLLRGVDAPVREVVLVSDLQRSGWSDFRGDWRLSPGVELTVRGLAVPITPADLAIVRAEVPRTVVRDGSVHHLAVRLANSGQESAEAVPVVLAANDREIARQTVTIPPGTAVSVRFRTTFDQAGDNLGTITIERADLCPDDDRRYFNTRVIPRLPVLLIGASGTPASRSVDSLLRTALAPAAESPFEVRSASAEAVTPADVDAARVVILADLTALPPTLVAAVGTLLRERGGGLLALPGSRVAPDTLAVPGAEDLSPCRLRRVVANGGRDGAAREVGLAQLDVSHPVFQVFQRPHHGDFTTLRVRRYWEVTGSQLSRVLARFEDGRPAILERETGAGVTMVWLTPPDPEWGNLPGRAIFLPLLHQTVRYLSLRTEPQADFAVGDLLPTTDDETVTLPDGTTVVGGELTAMLPGFYRVAKADGQARVLTVNLPLAEADAATVTADELRAALVTPVDAGTQTASAGPASGAVTDRGLWQALLGALLVVLLAELFVANRMLRH